VETSGKHAGKRRAEPAPKTPKAPASETGGSIRHPWAKLLPLALGVTLCVVAWGYLVYAAIDFGATARDGETRAWWFLAMASLGAVVCLFVGLLLVARLMRLVGVTKAADAEPTPPRPIGGKRAAR
jgi:amino acid permease